MWIFSTLRFIFLKKDAILCHFPPFWCICLPLSFPLFNLLPPKNFVFHFVSNESSPSHSIHNIYSWKPDLRIKNMCFFLNSDVLGDNQWRLMIKNTLRDLKNYFSACCGSAFWLENVQSWPRYFKNHDSDPVPSAKISLIHNSQDCLHT